MRIETVSVNDLPALTGHAENSTVLRTRLIITLDRMKTSKFGGN